jgi:amphi-Trp domain-containing protein
MSKRSKEPKSESSEDDAGAASADAEREAHDEPEAPTKAKISYNNTLTREEAVAYFEAIVDGMRKGTVQFRQAEDALALSLPAHVSVEVKAARKGDKSKISFDISWQGGSGAELSIVS